MAASSHHCFLKTLFITAGSVALISLSSQAQVYKWVDANGKVHFSDKKDQAGKKPVTEVKAKDPATNVNSSKTTDNWRERNDAYKERQANMKNDKPRSNAAPQSPTPPKTNFDGSNKSNCDLAKGILNGTHGFSNNGFRIPTGAADVQVAKRDVDIFCK